MEIIIILTRKNAKLNVFSSLNRNFALSLYANLNVRSIMTAVQLNAEIYRAMGVIAEDETLLARAAKYLKKLAAKKEDPTLMTKEEFFRRVDEAREEIRQGKGRRFCKRIRCSILYAIPKVSTFAHSL